MKYKVSWHEDAIKDLSRLDKQVAKKIISKVDNYLTKSPISLGMSLKGEFAGFYKYRIGGWRVIYYIDKEKGMIKILKIGHRREVYK